MLIRPTRFLSLTFLLTFILISFVQISPNSAPSIGSFWSSAPTDNAWPNKIWQTWKTSITDLSDEDAQRVRTWQDQNPSYRYELLSDASAEAFVHLHFDEEPLIKDTFFALTDKILRADFLRYLILLGEGGVYTDIDTTCLTPISNWIPEALKLPLDKYSVIVGIENDRPPVENDWKIYADYSSYIFRLENWTLASRRDHPFLRYVAEKVAQNLIALAKEKGKSLEDMEVGYRDVVTTTGPIAFTQAFFEYANKTSGKEWTYEDLTMLEEPALVGDIVILPIRAFSQVDADREGDGAHSRNWPNIVQHHSIGSWKAEHPQEGGEKSPEQLQAEQVQPPP